MNRRRPLARTARRLTLSPVVVAMALGCGVGRAQAQTEPLPRLSVDQIAARMQQRGEQRAAALHSYVSRRVMTVSYKGLFGERQASETVEMTFTAPGSKRFAVVSATGSSLLRERVLQREMESEKEAAAHGETVISPATYEMRVVGEERLPQGRCYVLQITPRAKGKYRYEGKIWVVAPDFAVVRVEAKPVENPSFWVKNGEFRTEFERLGEFWFPATMVSTSRVRFGGDATLTIQYGPYKIVSAEPMASAAAR